MDPRVKAFGEYLDEQITAQVERQYRDRESIESMLGVYQEVKRSYELMLRRENQSNNSDLYSLPISELGLSTKVENGLSRGEIKTIGELIEKSRSELISIPRFGLKSIREVQNKLEEVGVYDLPDAPTRLIS